MQFSNAVHLSGTTQEQSVQCFNAMHLSGTTQGQSVQCCNAVQLSSDTQPKNSLCSVPMCVSTSLKCPCSGGGAFLVKCLN